MRVKSAIFIAIFCAAFCAALGAGAPAAFAEGEAAVEQVNETDFLVVYRGDTRMSRRAVAEGAMLRAAELTIERGKTWFAVTGTHSNRVDLNTVDSLDRYSEKARDVSAGAGGGEAGSTGGGHDVTLGVDPGAVGVGTNAPSALLEQAERQRARRAYQTVLVIKIGTGTEVAVDDAEGVQVFDAASVVQSSSAQQN